MSKIQAFIENLFNNAPSIMKSKRFWTGFISGCVMIAVSLRPELEPHATQLQASILALALFLIKGYSDQDKASAENGINKYLDNAQAPATVADNQTMQLKKSS